MAEIVCYNTMNYIRVLLSLFCWVEFSKLLLRLLPSCERSMSMLIALRSPFSHSGFGFLLLYLLLSYLSFLHPTSSHRPRPSHFFVLHPSFSSLLLFFKWFFSFVSFISSFPIESPTVWHEIKRWLSYDWVQWYTEYIPFTHDIQWFCTWCVHWIHW